MESAYHCLQLSIFASLTVVAQFYVIVCLQQHLGLVLLPRMRHSAGLFIKGGFFSEGWLTDEPKLWENYLGMPIGDSIVDDNFLTLLGVRGEATLLDWL